MVNNVSIASPCGKMLQMLRTTLLNYVNHPIWTFSKMLLYFSFCQKLLSDKEMVYVPGRIISDNLSALLRDKKSFKVC